MMGKLSQPLRSFFPFRPAQQTVCFFLLVALCLHHHLNTTFQRTQVYGSLGGDFPMALV